MHKKSASLVKAEAQARMIQALQEEGQRKKQLSINGGAMPIPLHLPRMRLFGITEWLQDLRPWLDTWIRRAV